MLTSNKGIPAWRHPRCLPVMMSTGLTEGAGILAMWLAFSRATFSPTLSAALAVLLLARMICWWAYLGGLRADGAPQVTLDVLRWVHVPFVAIGHGVPAALILTAWAATRGDAGAIGATASSARVMMAVAGLLAVGSGWALKYTIVRRAAYTQGFALQHLPVRNRRTADLGTKPGWSPVDHPQQ